MFTRGQKRKLTEMLENDPDSDSESDYSSDDNNESNNKLKLLNNFIRDNEEIFDSSVRKRFS